ncbi:unnamed protein product [Porites evermanni]|uniref:Uncharacterized protein n=1 Tax=Porites evermanni TaxID=104178 RepID=A0ABN8MP26_9CNID|nr:unnamed protein product [Porites evermanni]
MFIETKMFLFVGALILYIETVTSCGESGKQWDRLLVNFLNPTPLPRTEDQALAEGWRNDASCDGKNAFHGNRYALGTDISTRLIFDNNGELAGIQATITESDELILSPTRPRPGAFVKDDHGHYLVTAYFTDKPSDICKKRPGKHLANGRHKKKDALVIQMSDVRLCKPEFMEIPLDERKLANTRWVKGKCFRGMGVHYWYDISPDMHCDQVFPVYLMYGQSSGRLKAFGWSVLANIQSYLWEHPPMKYFKLFFEEVPKCVILRKVISGQHIYLTDPKKLTCSTP